MDISLTNLQLRNKGNKGNNDKGTNGFKYEQKYT